MTIGTDFVWRLTIHKIRQAVENPYKGITPEGGGSVTGHKWEQRKATPWA
jgi:hypothetical protein